MKQAPGSSSIPARSAHAMMQDWNVVITVFQGGFKRAVRALRELGRVERSAYHNVLVMAVETPVDLLDAIERRSADDPALYDAISRIAPASRCFDFKTAQEFLRTSEGDRTRMAAPSRQSDFPRARAWPRIGTLSAYAGR